MIIDTTADEKLLLALLNTTPTIGGVPTDQLAAPEDAEDWLVEQQGVEYPKQDLGLLRSVRDTLQRLVRGERTLEPLVPSLDKVSYRAVISENGLDWELVTPPENAVAARAVLAWDTLRRTAAGRLRACANSEECTLFLIDHSKSNSARWCSMAGCGNRMKARRHYERTKNART